jgi:hypothetical protein
MPLEFRPGQKTLDQQQMQLLSPLGIKADYDPAQVMIFLLDCGRRGFDPWANEAYLMQYPGTPKKYVRHTGIAGFRRKAEESGQYRGMIGPQFTADGATWVDVWLNKNVPPAAARAGIMRDGFDGPIWGTAVYDEFVPMTDEYDGWGENRHKTGKKVPAAMWKPAAQGGKPSMILGKCAQAAAFRIAFPNRFNGWYEPAEFDRARAEHHDDEGTAKRRAAYEAATGKPVPAAAPPVVIDGTATDTTSAPDGPVAPESGLTITEERTLLLAELDEQAEVLGKTVQDLTARWSASREGRPIDKATVAELLDFVHRCRPYVVKALRDANQDADADRYANAPQMGTCQELFGRGPSVPEPPAGAVAADVPVAGTVQ